ncbi:uncharacterized protein EDB91DRAFT_1086269 [Suillus paluster]|uniref:uncharacterized protein n=1 Tax=Suillus paluster TaxID=48578 RepID=UPI001B86C731|nr:uncharacterized protein EDB91DRAFT_1086269 [Suillus paluster]KAG1727969.1 hypothetical protein EDB91DRAFT_1086269 [Suillus paluster]
MARSGHSTQLTSGRQRTHQPQSQKLRENEISELKNYLPEWTSAKRSEKQGVFNAIVRAARLFAPKVDQGQWKKRKQMYKTWLFNNKKMKEMKDMIKYGRKWMPRQVIYQQNREEVLKRIEDEFGAKPGGQDMFKYYQGAVKKVMAELSKDELEKVKETAKEWSNNVPPPEIQAQVACKKGPVYMEHFSNEMWRQCRMRVFVLSAWKNECGEVLLRMHDDNEALRDGDGFIKTKDWEDIEPVWQEYAQEQFGAEAWDGGQQVKGGDGMPLLPDIMETKLEQKKAIVRAFLTKHYPDVDLKEPSKLQNWDTTALLNFWYARQETGEGPMFLFKAWRKKEGDMVDSVVSKKSPPHQKCKRVMIRRPWDLSIESESDAEGNTHPDDEADVDSADGRSPQKRSRRAVGPASACEGTAVPHSISKPHPVKPAKSGALLTSQMGDLLAGFNAGDTGDVENAVPLPAPKSIRGKKDVIEAPARTTRSKSVQQPSDRVTRARGKK